MQSRAIQEGISTSIGALPLNTNNLVFWAPLRAAREVQRQIAGWHCPLLPGSKVKGPAARMMLAALKKHHRTTLKRSIGLLGFRFSNTWLFTIQFYKDLCSTREWWEVQQLSFEAVSQEMRPNGAFEVLAPLS